MARQVCAHGGTGEFRRGRCSQAQMERASEFVPGVCAGEWRRDPSNAGAGGSIGMKAGNAREGGMLILESGHSINGIGGNIKLLGIGRDSSDDAIALTTTNTYRGEEDETSGGICITSGQVRPQNEVGGSLELKSGNSQTTSSITAFMYASRFDAGGETLPYDQDRRQCWAYPGYCWCWIHWRRSSVLSGSGTGGQAAMCVFAAARARLELAARH